MKKLLLFAVVVAAMFCPRANAQSCYVHEYAIYDVIPTNGEFCAVEANPTLTVGNICQCAEEEQTRNALSVYAYRRQACDGNAACIDAAVAALDVALNNANVNYGYCQTWEQEMVNDYPYDCNPVEEGGPIDAIKTGKMK